LKKHKSGYVLYKIEHNNTIVLDKKSPASFAGHDELVYELQDEECRYVAYYLQYEHEQKTASKLFLFCWTPEPVNTKVSRQPQIKPRPQVRPCPEQTIDDD
jgi:hypothetical protein